MTDYNIDPLATAPLAARTLQEQSNLIERLATALAENPPKTGCADNYLMIFEDGIQWFRQLPEAQKCWLHTMAIGANGIIYSCEMDGWGVISEGLRATLDSEPHTFGFSMMDDELMADHIREAIHKWVSVNLTAEQQAGIEISIQTTARSEPRGEELARWTADLERNIGQMNNAVRKMITDLIPDRKAHGKIDKIRGMRRGAEQAIRLAMSLMAQAVEEFGSHK